MTATGWRPGTRPRASATATKAPVIAAVRVPPSAWITSPSRRALAGGLAGRAQPLVPVALVLDQAGEDRARELVAVVRVLEPPLLARVRDEADLEQDRGHGGAAQDVEARLLHAAIRHPERLGDRVVDDLGEARGLGLELRLGEVPEDRLQHVGLAGAAPRRLLELDHAV